MKSLSLPDGQKHGLGVITSNHLKTCSRGQFTRQPPLFPPTYDNYPSFSASRLKVSIDFSRDEIFVRTIIKNNCGRIARTLKRSIRRKILSKRLFLQNSRRKIESNVARTQFFDRFVEGRDSERLSKIGVVKLNRTWHAESSNGIPILRETRFLSERLSKIRKIKSNVAESHSNYDLLIGFRPNFCKTLRHKRT